MILLDTNVISEIMRERPDPVVRSWLRAHARNEFWTSSIVVAELLSGIDLMPPGGKQTELRAAVEGMITQDFNGQILKFDLHAARHYGKILSYRRTIGRPISEMDALIAATAKTNGAKLATRNISHFESCGVDLIDPPTQPFLPPRLRPDRLPAAWMPTTPKQSRPKPTPGSPVEHSINPI